MRDTPQCRWQRWRVIRVARQYPYSVEDRFTCRPTTANPVDNKDSGGDEIRHALVARIRAEIEAGTYETEDKWLAAEEALLRQVTRGW